MTRRVLLHVGAPKSGTTYLQSRLHRNAATLAEHGVLVPLGDPADRPQQLVFRAALDLTGVRLNRGRDFSDGYWPRLVERVAAHEGTTVVSHEAFVRSDDAAARRAVAELGAGAELHVVYTARDLGRSLVSGWLEGLKHGGTDSLDVHLGRARDHDLPLRTAFDVPTLLGRWLAHLPAERVHVVTVPPSGGDRGLLWTRFLSVGDLDGTWAPLGARAANESVGVAEAQVLRALNAALGGRSRRGHSLHPLVRDVVAGALVGRASTRVELQPAHRSWVAADAAATRAWLEASGVRLVGDLADLEPAAAPTTYVDPDAPHPDVAEAAAAALAAVVIEAHRRHP